MKNKTAFSLIELSVVLIIIAVFITTSMPIAKSVLNNYRVKITNERMNEIYKALGNFAKSYGRLPCPASMLLAKGNANYGQEVNCGTTISETPATNSGIWQANSSSNKMYGMVPIQALHLSSDMAEDGFGNKLAYSVLKDETTYNYSSGQQRITIFEKKASGYVEITHEVSFVIISYGANKYGAFPANATSQNTASFSASDFPTATSDEGENMLRIDNMSYSYTGPYGAFYNYGSCGSGCFGYTFIAASTDENFDDIVFYKTRSQLNNDFDLLGL